MLKLVSKLLLTLFLSLLFACSKHNSSDKTGPSVTGQPSQEERQTSTTVTTQPEAQNETDTPLPERPTQPVETQRDTPQTASSGTPVELVNETELKLEYDEVTQMYLVKRPKQVTVSIQKPHLFSENSYLCYQLNYFLEFEERLNQVETYIAKTKARIAQKSQEQKKLQDKLDQQWRVLSRKERSEIQKRIERLVEEIESLEGDAETADYRASNLLQMKNESKEILSQEGGRSEILITPNYKKQVAMLVSRNPNFRFKTEELSKDLKAEFRVQYFPQVGIENIILQATKLFGIKNKKGIAYVSQIPESELLNEKVSLFSSCLYESNGEIESAPLDPKERMEIKIDFTAP